MKLLQSRWYLLIFCLGNFSIQNLFSQTLVAQILVAQNIVANQKNKIPTSISSALQFSKGSEPFSFTGNHVSKKMDLVNKGNIPLSGTMQIKLVSLGKEGSGKTLSSFDLKSFSIKIDPNSSEAFIIESEGAENTKAMFTFTEKSSHFSLQGELYIPYILTPPPPATPRINGAKIVGVRPGADFLFSIPASGNKPMTFAASGLPLGIHLDSKTGILTGTCLKEGKYEVALTVNNSAGKTADKLVIVVGQKIGLTPAMGWNSWNAFGLSVNTEKVKDAVDAMKSKGLKDQGYTYINIDDGWEDSTRDAKGMIRSNAKFPNMNVLTDYIHAHGLKAGLYSSPGPLTCGKFLGSWQHEDQDAETWAKWGFDYIKYDWCSYGGIDTTHDKRRENFMRPYITMQKALAKTGRDIYFSLCQYGMGDVWKWGAEVNANSWRTTGDITDSWKSLSTIGFNQDTIATYARPGGGWNDPDMLIVGNVGWGPSLHPTNLTPDEQYTHISLWSLLAAPLLIGCDMHNLDPFTLNLLNNNEVIAIDQDMDGRQATRKITDAHFQVWVKELSGGKKAVGIFNLDNNSQKISIHWAQMGISNDRKLRDVWRQLKSGTTAVDYTVKIPPHGVRLLRVD